MVDEFMEEWSRGLPFGLKPSKEMLLGEAVVNEAQSIIKGFCKDDLPKECRARVKAVFSEKDLWNPDELRKYLCDAKVRIFCVLAMYIALDQRYLCCAMWIYTSIWVIAVLVNLVLIPSD